MEEFFWNFILHPPDEFLLFVSGEKFFPDPVNAEDIPPPVMMNYTLPIARADIKGIVSIFLP